MGFDTKNRPFDDIERQAAEKKAELEILQKKIDGANESLLATKDADILLEAKNKEIA